MCGKEVGSGFFPSDSLESQSYDFDEIAHIRPYIVISFVRIVWTVFDKIGKISKLPFLVIFGLILDIFHQSHSYDFGTIAHTEAPLGVE